MAFFDGIYNRLPPIRELKKEVRELRKEAAMRPPVDYTYTEEPSLQIPRRPLTYRDIEFIAKKCTVIRTCYINIRNEIFRRGYSWIPKFSHKCYSCGKEFEHKIKNNKCDNCGGVLIEPNPTEYYEAEEFFKKVNSNCKSLISVLKNFEDDLNIFDDAYLVIRKEYYQNSEGDIVFSKPVEIIRANPVFMRVVGDNKGNLGGKYYICLTHRDEVHNKPGVCRICNKKLFDVHYVCQSSPYSSGNIVEYYIKGEVIKSSKYDPGLFYGYSPILTLYTQVATLLKQEEYMYDAYRLQRNPKGILSVFSKSKTSIEKAWDEMLNRLKHNPHYLPLFTVDSEGEKGRMEFIKLLDNIEEMQYLAVRDEIRQRISALYGVSNIFMADTSTSGGLNNEGLQILVTNRAVEVGQNIYNGEVFPKLLEIFGIGDWILRLNPSEEMDETAELQRKQMKVSIAQAYKNLGFKVEIDETGEFIYSQPEATEITTPLEQLSQEPLNQTSVRMSGEPADVHKNSDILVKNEDDEEIIKEFWDLALNAVKAGTLFETYEGLSKAKSKKINSILAEAMKDGAEFSVSALIDKMLKIGGLDQEQAEKIIRTEHQAVSNKARELAFLKRDPEGEYRYRWSVVHDHRTSQICKDIEHEINNRGGKVALEEMKEIQKRISKQHLGEDWEYRDFVPHINCRSKLVRVVE